MINILLLERSQGKMHSFHLYYFTGCARVKQNLILTDLLDKQDATAININIDHDCLRISEVMDHIA